MFDIFAKVFDYWTPLPLTSVPPGRNVLADLNEANAIINEQEVEIAQLKVVIEKTEKTYAEIGELYLTSMREAMETIGMQVGFMETLAAEIEALKNPPAPVEPEYHPCDLLRMEKKGLGEVLAVLGLERKARETNAGVVARIIREMDIRDANVMCNKQGVLQIVPISA